MNIEKVRNGYVVTYGESALQLDDYVFRTLDEVIAFMRLKFEYKVSTNQ